MRHANLKRLAMVLAALALSGVGAQAAMADDIDTTPAWNGTNDIYYFGQEGTPTYGQTVLGTGETLSGFSFFMDTPSSVTFQGGVGAWDGSRVSSVLWSGPVDSTSGSGMEEVTFTMPGGVPLGDGQSYVLYATSLFSAGSGWGTWGLASGDPYPDGEFVYQNGDSLTEEWDGLYFAGDLAFRAFFGPANTVVFVPMPARGGFCTVEGNTNPSTGTAHRPRTFVDLDLQQVTSDPSYAAVVPASYVEGVGLTCDDPPAGYTLQGLAGEDQHVGSGLYPYFAPSGA